MDAIDKRQLGFCRQKSTIHALHSFRNFILKKRDQNKSVTAVMLDISGAFDNASWQIIIESLIKLECLKYLINIIISYFKDRKITTDNQHLKIDKTTSQGCPQGSCSGPSLWNILLNNLFELKIIKESTISQDFYIRCYADDIVIAIAYKTNEVEIKSHEKHSKAVLDDIYDWGRNSFLNFNVKKTQAIHFFCPKEITAPKIVMKEKEIIPEKLVKYLGIWFDEELKFEEHFIRTLDKGKKAFNISKSYCGRTWGINSTLTRTIYRTTIIPILTYGASITSEALNNKTVSNKIRTFQYNCNKSIIKSYRTISIVSASLLSNTLPLELEIFARGQIELARITGVVNERIFDNSLINSKKYKPIYDYSLNFDQFVNEENVYMIENSHDTKLNLTNKISLEPKINWYDLPLGRDKIFLPEVDNHINTSHDYLIFTDGSKKLEYGTGSGFIIQSQTEILIRKSVQLHPYCSVPQAEMFSIFKSLEWTLDPLNPRNKTILICTDSIGSIQTLNKSYNSDLIPYFINSILKKLKEINCTVSIAKVTAHKNIEGNEQADRLAKKAAKESSRFPDNKMPIEFNFLPLSYVKKSIVEQCTKTWLARAYDKNFCDDRAKLKDWTKNFIPSSQYISTKLPSICDFFTTQIITGHGCFKTYLFDFGIAKSNWCIVCKRHDLNAEDTPEHALFYCVKNYKDELAKLYIYSSKDLHRALKDENRIMAFRELCKNIVTTRNELIQIELERESSNKTSGKLHKKNNKVKLKQVSKIKKESPSEHETETLPRSKDNPTCGSLLDITSTSWLTDDQIYFFAEKTSNLTNNNGKFIIISPLITTNNMQLVSILNNELSDDTNCIMVIINPTGNHWILGLIHLKDNVITLLDSQQQTRVEYNRKEILKRLLFITILANKIRKGTFQSPTFCIPANNPQQNNDDDCGVFVCKHISNIMHNNSHQFTISTGEYRQEIINTLRDDTNLIRNRRVRLEQNLLSFITYINTDNNYDNYVRDFDTNYLTDDYEKIIQHFTNNQ